MNKAIKRLITVISIATFMFGQSLFAQCVERPILADGSYAPIEAVDLQLSGFTTSSEQPYQNIPFNFQFQITNASDVEAARNPILEVAIPSGVTILDWASEDGSHCNQKSDTWTCTMQDIGQFHAPEHFREINFTGVSSSTGVINITGTVYADGTDHCVDNNMDVVSLPIIGINDLTEIEVKINSMSQVMSMKTGDKNIFSAQVTNNYTESTAKSVSLSVVDLDYIEVQFLDGCLDNYNGELDTQETGTRCDLGDLSPEQSTEVSFEVTARDPNISEWPGIAFLSLNASSGSHDYYLNNNKSSILIDVSPSEVSIEPEKIRNYSQPDEIDLEISIEGSDELTTLVIGESFPITIEVKNNHPVKTATEPVIFFGQAVDTHINFSESCSWWGGNTLSPRWQENFCELRDISPGDSILIKTHVTATAGLYAEQDRPSVATFIPHISANEVDLDTTNNHARKVYAVIQDPISAVPPEPPTPPISPALSRSENGGGGSFGFSLFITLMMFLRQLYHRTYTQK